MATEVAQRLVDRFRLWMAEQQDDLEEGEDPLWIWTEAKRINDPELNDTEGIKILFYWLVEFVGSVLEEERVLDRETEIQAFVDPHHLYRSRVLVVYKGSFVVHAWSVKHWYLFGMADDQIDGWLGEIKEGITEGLGWAKEQMPRPKA